MIIESHPSDAKEIARLHHTSGVAGILGKLSIETLNLNFYLPLLLDNQILKYSKINVNHKIIGFVALRRNANKGKINLPTRNIRLFINLLFALLKSPNSVCVILNVLRTEGKILKIFGLQKASFGEIQILTVERDYQGMGYGADLLEKVLKNSDQTKFLVKTQSLRARDFYVRHGFAEIYVSKFLGSSIFVLLFSKGQVNES